MNDVVKQAVDKILALRELTRTTGFRTTRSQNEILQKLNPDDLAEAAKLLAPRGGRQ